MISRSIQSVVKRLALAVALYLAVSLPIIFFAVSLKSEKDHMAFLAKINAEKVSNYIFINSGLWQYHRQRLEELVSLDTSVNAEHSHKYEQYAISLKGKTVFGTSRPLAWHEVEQSAPFYLAEDKVGQLTLRASLSPILEDTGLVAAIALLFAFMTHLAIHRWPLRVVQQVLDKFYAEQARRTAALKELQRTERALANRSEQLVEAQKMGKIGDWALNVSDNHFSLSDVTKELLELGEMGREPTLDDFVDRMSQPDGFRVKSMVAEALRNGEAASADIDFRINVDHSARLAITCSAVRDQTGSLQKLTGTIQDITERREAELQLENLAYFDPLTGLANRAMFKRELAEITRQLNRGEDICGSVLLLDLDRFKEVNDSLGHGAGDDLLCKVSQQISQILRGKHFCARLGGDEFALIIRDMGNIDLVHAYAEQILDAIAQPYIVGKSEVSIGTSIGIARFPDNGNDYEVLITHADLALYRAKELGRGQFVDFLPEMSDVAIRKMALAQDLREAVQKEGELQAWLQPQIDIQQNRIVAFEALMRWQHPELGFIPPSEFIPIAESSSLICDIGNWVLRESVKIAKQWIDEGHQPYEVAVNVSAAQIWQGNITEEVATALEASGLPPHLLCIELTESLFLNHAESSVLQTLNSLKSLGVTLALDDFGTGYSSLGYLVKLPFDKLKIDRVFITDSYQSDKKKHMLEGIIALGKGLGMNIVAEGVEKQEELALLKELNCDLVQGYLYAKPAPSSTIIETTQSSIKAIQKAA